jgi:hypothetical protein
MIYSWYAMVFDFFNSKWVNITQVLFTFSSGHIGTTATTEERDGSRICYSQQYGYARYNERFNRYGSSE